MSTVFMIRFHARPEQKEAFAATLPGVRALLSAHRKHEHFQAVVRKVYITF